MFYCVFASIYCEFDVSVFRVEIDKPTITHEEGSKKGDLGECANSSMWECINSAMSVPPPIPDMYLLVII